MRRRRKEGRASGNIPNEYTLTRGGGNTIDNWNCFASLTHLAIRSYLASVGLKRGSAVMISFGSIAVRC